MEIKIKDYYVETSFWKGLMQGISEEDIREQLANQGDLPSDVYVVREPTKVDLNYLKQIGAL